MSGGTAEALVSTVCTMVSESSKAPKETKGKNKKDDSSLATLGWIVGGVALAGVLLAVNPALGARLVAALATKR